MKITSSDRLNQAAKISMYATGGLFAFTVVIAAIGATVLGTLGVPTATINNILYYGQIATAASALPTSIFLITLYNKEQREKALKQALNPDRFSRAPSFSQ